MISRYEDFLESEGALSFEAADKVYRQLLGDFVKQDPAYKQLLEDMIAKALIYAAYRMKWSMMTRQERNEMDEERSRNHDVFIAALNKLSVYMYEHKYGNAWEDSLGSDRRTLGDFACYLAYVYGLNAR